MYLDANRGVLDVYHMGWDAYLKQRADDEARRRRERLNAEKKAEALRAQGEKMRAKANQTPHSRPANCYVALSSF